MFDPQQVTVSRYRYRYRYRYRGDRIPSPWASHTPGTTRVAQRRGLVESRMPGDAHVRFGGRVGETCRAKSR